MTSATTSSPDVPSPVALAQRVIPRAILKGIRMLRGSFECEGGEHDSELGIRSGHKCHRDGDTLEVTVLLEWRQPIRPDVREYVHVAAAFRIDYGIADGPDLPSEELEAFAKINGTYNAWPYWREFTDNAIRRMQVAVTPIQLLSVRNAVELAGYRDDPPTE